MSFLVVKYFTFIIKGLEFDLTFDIIRVFLWLFEINTQGNLVFDINYSPSQPKFDPNNTQSRRKKAR